MIVGFGCKVVVLYVYILNVFTFYCFGWMFCCLALFTSIIKTERLSFSRRSGARKHSHILSTKEQDYNRH